MKLDSEVIMGEAKKFYELAKPEGDHPPVVTRVTEGVLLRALYFVAGRILDALGMILINQERGKEVIEPGPWTLCGTRGIDVTWYAENRDEQRCVGQFRSRAEAIIWINNNNRMARGRKEIRLPDTFVERAIRFANEMNNPEHDGMVMMSAFEASTIRREWGRKQ